MTLNTLEMMEVTARWFTNDPTSTLEDAFAQWQKEREAMREIYDENEALKILNRRLILALALSEKAINLTEIDASMFIKDSTRKIILQFRDMLEKLSNTITLSKEFNHEQTTRPPASND